VQQQRCRQAAHRRQLARGGRRWSAASQRPQATLPAADAVSRRSHATERKRSVVRRIRPSTTSTDGVPAGLKGSDGRRYRGSAAAKLAGRSRQAGTSKGNPIHVVARCAPRTAGGGRAMALVLAATFLGQLGSRKQLRHKPNPVGTPSAAARTCFSRRSPDSQGTRADRVPDEYRTVDNPAVESQITAMLAGCPPARRLQRDLPYTSAGTKQSARARPSPFATVNFTVDAAASRPMSAEIGLRRTRRRRRRRPASVAVRRVGSVTSGRPRRPGRCWRPR